MADSIYALPAGCTIDRFLSDECAELPLSLANAEDALVQLEPTPDDFESDWIKLRSFVDGMQVSKKPQPEGVGYWDGTRRFGTHSGKTLAAPMLGDISTFNPLKASSTNDITVLNLLFTPLLRQDAEDFSKPAPGLVQRIEESSDHTTFTLYLEPMRWSDGRDCTANDLIFTFQTVYANKSELTKWKDDFVIDGKTPEISKIDTHTVRFTFAKPFPFFSQRIVNLFIVPKHFFAGKNSENLYTAKPDTVVIGNGPYMLQRYSSDEAIILVRNPHYYRKDARGVQLPYLNRIALLFTTKENALPRFTSGELHLLDALPPDSVSSKLPSGSRKVGPFLTTTTIYLYFNAHQTNNPAMKPEVLALLQDAQFREAVDSIIPRTYLGSAISRSEFAALHCYTNQLDPWQGTCPVFEKNEARAQELMSLVAQRHQLTKNSVGVYQFSDGAPVRLGIMYPPTSRPREMIATTLQEDFKKLGIELFLSTPDFNSMTQTLSGTSQPWDMALQGFTNDPYPALDAEDTFSPGGSRWYPYPQQQQFVEWEEQIRQAFAEMKHSSPEQAAQLWQHINRIHREQRAFLPIISAAMVHLASDQLCNLATNPYANPLRSNLEEVFWKNSRGECAPE